MIAEDIFHKEEHLLYGDDKHESKYLLFESAPLTDYIWDFFADEIQSLQVDGDQED